MALADHSFQSRSAGPPSLRVSADKPRISAPDDAVLDATLLTIKDVQRITCLGRTLIFDIVRRGDLPVVRFGRAVRIRRSTLDRWITEHETDVQHSEGLRTSNGSGAVPLAPRSNSRKE